MSLEKNNCRVCLRKAEAPLNIFDSHLDIASILQQHFWFEPLPNDGSSDLICHNCWTTIRDFHDFYQEVEKVHLELHAKCTLQSNGPENVLININVKSEVAEEVWPDNPGKENVIEERMNAELLHNEIEAIAQGTKKEFLSDADDYPKDPIYLETVKNPLYEPEVEIHTSKEEPFTDTSSSTATKETDIEEDLSTESGKKSKTAKSSKKVRLTSTPRAKRKNLKRKVKESQVTSKNDSPPKPKRAKRHMITSKDNEIIRKHIPMGCDICTFVGNDFAAMCAHFRATHVGVRPYVKCCDRKLNKQFQLVQHAYKHEDPEYFKCQDCQKVFSDTYVLRAHILAIHAPEEELKYSCDECPKRFSRRYLLELHKPSHIPVNERKFACDKCPNSKPFASEHLLLIHVNMRHTKATNVCHVCAKEIRDNRAFEKHVRLHFEDSGPRIKCPLPNCDRWLKDEDNMKQHMRRHNDEGKVFTCDECGKTCKNRRSLTCHLNYAHSKEVFTCGECQKTFKKAITLREHMAQHTGESLYKCPFCARTFNSNANMHSHKKKMHPIEWDIWRKTKKGSSQQVVNNVLASDMATCSFNNVSDGPIAKETPVTATK